VVVKDLVQKLFVLEGHYVLRPDLRSDWCRELLRRRSKKDANVHNRRSFILECNDLDIESIEFMTDNTLVVLTADMELRVLYTEHFNSDRYQ